MPETNPTPINPADLPADEWIPYADFASFMPSTNRRQVEDNAKAGRWIAGVRFSPRKPMHWRAGDVARALKLRPTTPDDRLFDAIAAAASALHAIKGRAGNLMEDGCHPDLRRRDQARVQEALGCLVKQTDVIVGLLQANKAGD